MENARIKKLIYLVEDSEEISEIIEYLFTDLDYDIRSFLTVANFKKSLKNDLPDLIILDIMLPDGNGIEICKELKINETTNYIPVILMSAYLNIETSAMAAGANNFISKPFDINDFVEKVTRQFELI